MTSLTLAETAALLRTRDNYLLLTHRRPDGDTIGSAAALCRGLRALGKTAAVLENPQFTPKFRPYLDGLTVSDAPEGAFPVAVDVASAALLAEPAFSGAVALLIDHHGSNSGFAGLGFVDPTAAACGEIILSLLEQLAAPVDRATAEALYVAISTDTGCFRYSNVTARTFRAAAACKDFGADVFAVNRAFFSTKRLPRLRLEAYLTQNTEFYGGGLVAVSVIPDGLRRELGVTPDDIDDISGFGREIEGVAVAVLLRRETPGEIRLSLRTAPGYDASAICARLGGGGHAAAAGATLPGDFAAAKKAVLQALAESGVEL